MGTSSVTEIRRQLERKKLIRRILAGIGILGLLAVTHLGMNVYLEFEWEALGTFSEWFAWIASIGQGWFLLPGESLPGQLNEQAKFVNAFFPPDFVDFTAYSSANDYTGLSGVFRSLANPGVLVDGILGAEPGDARYLVPGTITTVTLGFVGTVLGFPLAFLFGVLGSERVTPFPFNFIFRGVMSTIRSIPALVWILIYVPIAGIGVMTALLAITTDTIGNLGRLFTDELEEIEEGPIEAIKSTGASRPQTVLFGMLSQVSNAYIAWTLYILEINTRIAISLGVVGAGGLGQYIEGEIRLFNYGEGAAGIVMVIFLVITVELISSRVRAHLRPGETESKSLIDVIRDLGNPRKWSGINVRPEDPSGEETTGSEEEAPAKENTGDGSSD